MAEPASVERVMVELIVSLQVERDSLKCENQRLRSDLARLEDELAKIPLHIRVAGYCDGSERLTPSPR